MPSCFWKSFLDLQISWKAFLQLLLALPLFHHLQSNWHGSQTCDEVSAAQGQLPPVCPFSQVAQTTGGCCLIAPSVVNEPSCRLHSVPLHCRAAQSIPRHSPCLACAVGLGWLCVSWASTAINMHSCAYNFVPPSWTPVPGRTLQQLSAKDDVISNDCF